MSSMIDPGTTVRAACGVGRAGGDGVDADVRSAQLVRQLHRDAVHPGLRQAVVVGVHPRRGRGLVDDRAAAAGSHVLPTRTDAQQRTVHVHAHEAPVVVPVDGQQQVDLHAAEDRGVVDQVVDATELGHRRGGHLTRSTPGRTRRRAAPSARPPDATMSLATRSAPARSMSATTTAAPSAASAGAYPSPMPPPDPVTMLTFSSNLLISVPLSFPTRPSGRCVCLLVRAHAQRATAIALVSRYSSNPAMPISRPMPDCL